MIMALPSGLKSTRVLIKERQREVLEKTLNCCRGSRGGNDAAKRQRMATALTS